MTAFKIETLKNGTLAIEDLNSPLMLIGKNGDFVTIHVQKDRILVGHDDKVAEFKNGNIEVLNFLNSGE
jgi:hypothetical protein